MTPVQLTAHFTRAEFTCACGCGLDAIDLGLVEGLERLRVFLNLPVRVTSGCRCQSHNAAVGGAPGSQHVLGKAADVKVAGMTARELYAAAVALNAFHGFGVDDERGFVHLDVRNVAARWCYHDGREIPWQTA